MAYTQAQLVAAYTAANNGVAPDAATTTLLAAYALQNQAGQKSDADTLAFVINSAQDDVQVALQAYQFFTGSIPSKDGLAYLTNSAANTTDLNDPYYAQFNLENRYINFAANLGINGAGATQFAATYGSMNFATFVNAAYETIIGSSYATAAKINVSAAIADIVSRQAAFVQTARDRGIINATSTAAQIDIATKAAVVGYLMAEGVKADVGLYAAGANNFVQALISGTAQYGVNMLTVYSPLGGGLGSAVPGGGGPTGTGLLTVNPETLTANIFNAPQAYTPGGNDLVNTLQNDDFLTGIGADPTLNVTLGNPNDNGVALITPSLRGVEVINARFDATSANMVLDLQDTTGTAVNTGVDTINITRIAAGANATIQNIAESIATNLSVSNSQATSANVLFTYLTAALAGGADKGTVALSNVDIGLLRIEENQVIPTEGFETLTVNSVGSANKVGTLQAEDVQTLNITGDKNLTLGGTTNVAGVVGFNGTVLNTEATRNNNGLANMAGSLTKIDASTFKGNLDITIGTEFQAGKDDTSGQAIQLSVIGGDGNDTFRLSGSIVNGVTGDVDTINGGGGNNTLVVTGTSTVTAAGTAAAPVANVTNVQALQIRSGQDDAGVAVAEAADTITINADAFDKLATIFVRNEGQMLTLNAGPPQFDAVPWISTAEGLILNLTNLTSAQINAITVAHGTTGNSSLGNNSIGATLKVATGTADTSTVTIVDGTNTDPVFNFSFTAPSVERMAFVDSDTESNSVFVAPGTYAATGTATAPALAGSSITLTGGAAGKYFNLDTQNATLAANAPNANAGYGYATDGSATSATSTSVTTTTNRDTAVSSVFFGAGANNGIGAVASGYVYTGENLVAGAYLGDVVIRLGDVTRADGFSSQSLTTGVGNDTFIFDAQGVANAGFTSGDTITAGTGTDVLVLDGNHNVRIDVQTSEWDNLKGIDVLRLAGNKTGQGGGVANVGAPVANTGGGYYVAIDNDFISQTDAGNRLTIINNDGALNLQTESDAVIDLRGLSQSKWVTYVGANGNSGAVDASSRVILDDVSANANMILNGGDDNTTTASLSGNVNVYEVRNTANVSINDLSQTRNFGLIEFRNDQAVAQTLTLTLNDTTIGNLVDASFSATTAAPETLTITAFDNGGVASALNVNASAATSGAHRIVVTGSNIAADTIVGTGGADTITGARGSDILTGGGGADIFAFDGSAGATTSGATFSTTFDSITDFVVGTDKLQFTNVVDVVSGQQAAVQAAVTALGAGATDAQVFTAMAAANTTNLGVSFAVSLNGNTYAFFETTGASAGVAADDVSIKLVGLTTLPTFAGDVIP